jgi:type IV secretory pathway VirB2 component (pilin)
MRAIGTVPNGDAAATAFLNTRATPAELAAAQATPATHRDLWIKVALRIAGEITGNEGRDLRVIHEMVTGLAAFSTLLSHRDPGGFPD